VNACFCCVRFSFFHTKPRDWLEETSPKWPILYRVGRKTITQTIHVGTFCVSVQLYVISQFNYVNSVKNNSYSQPQMSRSFYFTDQLFPLDGQTQPPCQKVPGNCDVSCERICTGVCHGPVGVSSNAMCPRSLHRWIPKSASVILWSNIFSKTACTIAQLSDSIIQDFDANIHPAVMKSGKKTFLASKLKNWRVPVSTKNQLELSAWSNNQLWCHPLTSLKHSYNW